MADSEWSEEPGAEGPAMLLLVAREFWIELVAAADAEGVRPGALLEMVLREHIERKSLPERG